MCSSSLETLIHALWKCPGAFDVWGESLSPVNKWPAQFPGFLALWQQMVFKLSPKELAISANILRNIWFRRNALCFQNLFEDPSRLIRRAINSYEDYIQAQTNLSKRHQTVSTSSGTRHWKCPSEHSLKVNYD